ncbi:MAG: tetratricopeptide (TPR) repeat protein [Desulforhopalus sp.]|jgi:tetratricopeptide (TPR) repeat protein
MDNILFSISPRKQTLLWLKVVFFSPIVFFVFLCTSHSSFANGKEIAPERDISVVRDSVRSPDWKILWDGARNLVREGQYLLAAGVYGQLFSIKPNIEEANWEYCKVLLQTKSYQTAFKIISLLLEKNPTKNEYLLVAGQVAAHQEKYTEAERYFGLIFEKAPTGTFGDAALEGLAYSLRSRGHKDLAFPLMQQLAVRQPDNKKILQNYALDASFLKRFDISRLLYRKLLAEDVLDEKVLFQAASVFDEKGLEKEQNAIFERYLKLHPEYLAFRLQLIERYKEDENYDGLMDHLLFLIENSKNKREYLLLAAEISTTYLRRPDKALSYLEQLRSIQPDDPEVIAKINELQIQLAADFLSIVENGGTDLLWSDLDSIGTNRRSIFERMAVLLEKQRKYVPLIDILEVLYKHGVMSETSALHLSQLLHAVHKYDKSQHYALLVPENVRDESYYLIRADNEMQLGLEIQSFASLNKALECNPDDVLLRKKCIELSGRLGFVEDQMSLFNYRSESTTHPVPHEMVTAHISMLALNGIFEEGLRVCDISINNSSTSSDLIQLYLLKADLLRKSGKTRGAEQLLRQLLHEKTYQNTVLLQLVDNSIADRDLVMARKWLDLLNSPKVTSESQVAGTQFLNKKRLLLIRLLRLEEEFDEAANVLEQSISENMAGNRIFLRSLLKEKCYLYLADGNYSATEETLKTMENSEGFDADIFVLYEELLHNDSRADVPSVYGQKLRRGDTVLFSRVLSVVEKEIEKQFFKSAAKHFALVDGISDDSIRLRNLSVKFAVLNGLYGTAKHDLEILGQRFGGEIGFCKQQIEIFGKTGQYQDALKKYIECFPRTDQGIDNTGKRLVGVEEEVLYARILWGAKQYEDSLAVYRELLDPPVYQQLTDQFRDKRINYQYLTRQQSLWSSMMLLIESDPEIIAELMEPQFLVSNIGNETGKIVADNYEQYSWQRLIENEFLARKAIFNKNYHFAAKSYEKLLEEEETTESKVDLATIYGRIGKFRKEAQVYEEISNVGEVTPELQESIKRNFLQIRPTNTIDTIVEERKGRQDSVDIRKTSLGTTFWFTPDLDKDFWFSYAYNQYETSDGKGEIDSNIIRGAMTYEFSGNYELVTGLGAEKLNDSSDSEIQYNFELKGQLDDYVAGFVLFEKEPIDDTLESLEAEIYRQFVQTGLTIETELGVTFGGDLRYSLYSDDNEQKRFYWFSSYSIFSESLQFDMRYSYQYLDNKDVNWSDSAFSEDIDDDFVSDYWSPDSYSEHRFGVQIKKDFFGYLTDVENKMSYFRFDTGISLEDEENIAYSALFDIFLEMSPHLLLKGNFSFSSSDVYDEKRLTLSLHYSW